MNNSRPRSLSILSYILLIIMLLPEAAFNIGSIYTSKSPGNIEYTLLDYHFGLLHLFICIVGLFLALKYQRRALFVVFIIQLLREILFVLNDENSIFVANAYEIYLIMLCGISFTYICYYLTRNPEKFFKLFLLFNMLTIYGMVLIGHDSEGRYNSVNMDVGATGTLCAYALLYMLEDERKTKWIWIGLIIGGLFLSGSRANLALAFVCGAGKIWGMIKDYLKKGTGNRFRRSVFITIGILVALAILPIIYRSVSIEDEDRLTAMTSSSEMSDDPSVLGRTLSLTVGLDILSSHSWGISGYTINLQQEMQRRGYPTYPHSYILSEYILLGPIVLFFYCFCIWMLFRLYKRNKKYFSIILYTVLLIPIYGAPILNFKVFFMFAMLIMLAYPYCKIRLRTTHKKVYK